MRLRWPALASRNPITTPLRSAFYFGSKLLVECDIVLTPNTPLHDAHEIGNKPACLRVDVCFFYGPSFTPMHAGESLQQKLETVESVDRAFVHLDYEIEHDPNAEHKLITAD